VNSGSIDVAEVNCEGFVAVVSSCLVVKGTYCGEKCFLDLFFELV